MNEIRDTSTNYEFSSVTEGVDQTTNYTPATNLNQSSTNKIYNVQNVSDNDSTSYAEVDKNQYNSNGSYSGSNGFDSFSGEMIDIELPLLLDISSAIGSWIFSVIFLIFLTSEAIFLSLISTVLSSLKSFKASCKSLFD